MAWTRVQTFSQNAQFTGTAVASTSATLATAISVGDVICLITSVGLISGAQVNWDDTASVTDQLGNVWVRVSYEQGGRILDNSDGQAWDIWWTIVAHAGTSTITYRPTTLQNQPFLAIKGSHFSGGDANSYRRVVGGFLRTNPGVGTNAITTGSIAAANGDLVWAAAASGSVSTAIVGGTGFTATTVDATSGLIDEWQTATGSTAGTFTDGTNGGGAIYAVAALAIVSAGAGTGTGTSTGLAQVIQSVSTPNTQYIFTPATGVPGMTVRLPDPGSPGNCFVLLVRRTYNASLTSSIVRDDQCNPGWALIVPSQDGSQNVRGEIWACPAIRNGTREVTILFSGTNGGNVACALVEIAGIGTVTPWDTGTSSSTGGGSATAVWSAGSMSPHFGNEFCIYFGICENSAANTLTSAWTAGTGFSLELANVTEGIVVQWQQLTAQTPINPTTIAGSAQKYMALALCLKTSATAGTVPSPTQCRIRRLQIQTFAIASNPTSGQTIPTTQTIQFPCSGNAIVARANSFTSNPNTGIASITDTNSNTYSTMNTSPSSLGAIIQLFYTTIQSSPAFTSANNLVMTLTQQAALGDEFMLYDLVNVGGVDVLQSGSGNQAAANGNAQMDLSTISLTPSVLGGIMICGGDQNDYTSTGLGGAGGGLYNTLNPLLFDQPTWPNQNEDGGHVAGANAGFTCDSMAGGHVYPTSLSATSFVYDFSALTSANGVGAWGIVGIALKPLNPSPSGDNETSGWFTIGKSLRR